MTARLNHTIVAARDQDRSATFLAEMLGLPAPLRLGHFTVVAGELSLPADALPKILVAMVYPVAIWAWCLALLGTATRFLSTDSRVIRYLSDASYWIYLVHLPVVVALQVWVSTWSVGWQVKYPLILAIAIPLLVASYQLFVRNTWIGAWLNGRRYGRPPLSEKVAIL